jgi:hypothetical protein
MAGRPDLGAAQRGTLLADVAPQDLVGASAAVRRRAKAAGPAGRPAAILDGGERIQVLDTLIAVLGGAYAHLPAKRAAYAVDPVQALTLLRRRATDLTDADFHLRVTGLVTGLRDGHTRYVGPTVLRERVAALPFLVEQYGPFGDAKFLVTKTSPEVIDDPEFVPGVRLERFNAIPFARAVDIYADRETGGRPDARRARALESFTFRALDYGPPPDEEEIVIDYQTRRGKPRRLRLPWRVLEPGRASTAVRPGTRAHLKVAANPAAEAVRRAKKLLFSPELWQADAAPVPAAPPKPPSGATGWIPTPFQDTVAACARKDGTGYLRLWSFDVDDDDAYLAEVTRLLGLLPKDRLVVDLRGNPGGLVWAAERLLQLFTDGRRVTPTRFSLVASPLTREMARSPFNRMELEAWAPSLEDAVSTGEQYSQPLPLTDPAWCNDLGRAFHGKALAVVDANTYSSGDLFAAGWVDHEIGPLVTVGQATGAGGANVWTDAQLRDALTGTEHAFEALPAGGGFTVAIRRAIRSGISDGIPIEDLGIAGIPYDMTENDLLHGNRDLLAYCTGLLT